MWSPWLWAEPLLKLPLKHFFLPGVSHQLRFPTIKLDTTLTVCCLPFHEIFLRATPEWVNSLTVFPLSHIPALYTHTILHSLFFRPISLPFLKRCLLFLSQEEHINAMLTLRVLGSGEFLNCLMKKILQTWSHPGPWVAVMLLDASQGPCRPESYQALIILWHA